MRTSSPVPHCTCTKANRARSVEHNDVDIVAVNDPFIEPHYAVSITRSSKYRQSHPFDHLLSPLKRDGAIRPWETVG